MWKLWDQFGIETAEMSGFWTEHPAVTTDRKDVYATAFIKKDKTLVAIGNWADVPVEVRLQIDWKRLGIDPAESVIVAPAIEDYQPETRFDTGGPFPLSSKGDLLLEISKKGQEGIR